MLLKWMLNNARIACLWVLGFLALAGYASGAAASGETPKAWAIALTWSDDPATTQTISWKTDAAVNSGCVQYQPADDSRADQSAWQKQSATSEPFMFAPGDHAQNIKIFTTTLTGLKSKTRYCYAVQAGGETSETHIFSTADPAAQDFTFLVFGDSQSGDANKPDYSAWHTTLQNAYQLNPDAKFFVNVGDLVETGQNYAHWEHWFAAARGVIDAIPAMPVEGNHEIYGPGKSGKPLYFISQFKIFPNGPAELQGQVYSYNYGPAHLVVLDSQAEEEAPRGLDILKIQSQWLEKDLAAARQPWKIVFFHKGPYCVRLLRANEDVKQAFCPLLDKYHVDVVFNGHDHGVARTYPMNGDKRAADPKAGTVYYIAGRSGAKYYRDLSAKTWDAFFFNPEKQPCYVVAQIHQAKLAITVRNQDGTLLDAYTIEKEAEKSRLP